jgi:hypothetical protein
MHVSTFKPGESVRHTENNLSRELMHADSLAAGAENEADCRAAMQKYKAILAEIPYHFHAAVSVSHLNLLIGDAFSVNRKEKSHRFREAIHYAEMAMGSNEKIRNGFLSGKRPWEMTNHFTVNEMEAIAFWINGLYYYYKDCQGPIGQMANFRWIRRAKQLTERMTELDPEWGGGMVYFLWGIYYLAIPSSVGGDPEKAAEYFQKAVETGPDWPHYRWGRGKYFHVKMKNREGFREDLEWVIQRDISKLQGHGAWKRFFRRDAEKLLNDIDKRFE